MVFIKIEFHVFYKHGLAHLQLLLSLLAYKFVCELTTGWHYHDDDDDDDDADRY